MKRKIITIAAAGILAISTLAGCGGGNSDGGSSKIRVAATAAPHAEILQSDVVRNALSKEGYELEVKVFQDYVQPNNVVESGELDANYFQHITYLNDFNKESGTHLVSAGGIHYEPFGIYAGQKKDLSELADGDSIAVPNDTTNEARALLLLQDNDFIKLKDGAGLTATKMDIVENPHNLEIVELEAAQVPHQLDSVSFAVMNGNYAMEAGFKVATDALAYEAQDSDAAESYVNVIAVKEGKENDPGIKALVKVLKSDEVKAWMEKEYEGSVVPYSGD
jgi:D-methionine transport system substrate-binding protein